MAGSAIAAVGGIASGLIGGSSAGDAADAQVAAAQQAAETQLEMQERAFAETQGYYIDALANSLPERSLGLNASAALASELGLGPREVGFYAGGGNTTFGFPEPYYSLVEPDVPTTFPGAAAGIIGRPEAPPPPNQAAQAAAAAAARPDTSAIDNRIFDLEGQLAQLELDRDRSTSDAAGNRLSGRIQILREDIRKAKVERAELIANAPPPPPPAPAYTPPPEPPRLGVEPGAPGVTASDPRRINWAEPLEDPEVAHTYSGFELTPFQAETIDYSLGKAEEARLGAASRLGSVDSGATREALEQEAQQISFGQMTTIYNDYLNRLASLAGMGSGVGAAATGQGVGVGQTNAGLLAATGQGVAQTQLAAGNAAAGGIAGQTSAYQTGLQNAVGALGNVNWSNLLGTSQPQASGFPQGGAPVTYNTGYQQPFSGGAQYPSSGFRTA